MRLLFLGDSISNGSGATGGYGYAPRVVTELRRDIDVVAANESAGGRTVRDGVKVARDRAVGFNPEVAVVCFGANDQKLDRRGRPLVPVNEYAKTLGGICWHVASASPGCRVLVLPPPPLPPYLHEPYVQACGTVQREVIPLDGYEREWLADDGHHPDDVGHDFIAARVLDAIHRQPQSWRAPPSKLSPEMRGLGFPLMSSVG